MNGYNKTMAITLLNELREAMNGIPDQIESANDNGPVVAIICEGLAKAIAALKTKVN